MAMDRRMPPARLAPSRRKAFRNACTTWTAAANLEWRETTALPPHSFAAAARSMRLSTVWGGSPNIKSLRHRSRLAEADEDLDSIRVGNRSANKNRQQCYPLHRQRRRKQRSVVL